MGLGFSKYNSTNLDDVVIIDVNTSCLHIVEKHQILYTAQEDLSYNWTR